MTISIGNNIASLQAQRKLSAATDQLSSTFEKLSSGLRINSAVDDPAGLAMADSLRANQKIASVAIRNANDGISAISLADGAFTEIANILQRLSELAEQSANGVYSTTQRSALQSEFAALGSEIERIANTTSFNGINLLSAGTSIVLQVGFDSAATSQIQINGVKGNLQSLGLAQVGSAAMTFSLTGTTIDNGVSASRLALEAVNAAINSLSQTRGSLGAVQSRLEMTINNLATTRENLAAAESRVRDVDVASEAAELTRLTVLQQAATAVLAQANQQPTLALNLLQ
ncbi:MAG: flagellin FliC [SAR324 cluster bacterium]|uniref:Flagellin n=1 Tax=SAR324 cluster bacterium TaxID=2024889 RepID=A0A7X9IK79_9DELT|nr:flagellin FliC [SAR324 cluster bacterium]